MKYYTSEAEIAHLKSENKSLSTQIEELKKEKESLILSPSEVLEIQKHNQELIKTNRFLFGIAAKYRDLRIKEVQEELADLENIKEYSHEEYEELMIEDLTKENALLIKIITHLINYLEGNTFYANKS